MYDVDPDGVVLLARFVGGLPTKRSKKVTTRGLAKTLPHKSVRHKNGVGAGSIGRALVVANGDLPGIELLEVALGKSDFVLAADGGASSLISAGIVPNAVLGDFDSLTTDLPDSVLRVPAPDQDFTDLDKAVAWLIDAGASSIAMTGVTGDRLDHTFGALAVLAKYGRRVPLTLLDQIGTAHLVAGELELGSHPGQTVSLMPLGHVEGVTTAGLKWPLAGESLAPGVRDGTSNLAVSGRIVIQVGAGDLIVYLHHGR